MSKNNNGLKENKPNTTTENLKFYNQELYNLYISQSKNKAQINNIIKKSLNYIL